MVEVRLRTWSEAAITASVLHYPLSHTQTDSDSALHSRHLLSCRYLSSRLRAFVSQLLSPLPSSSRPAMPPTANPSSDAAVSAVPPSLTPLTDPDDPLLSTLTALFTSTAPAVRLQAELEFVSLLANPFYLHHLAAHAYLSQPSFLCYLSYLLHCYSRPPLLELLPFPHALHTLRLLVDSSEFRRECGRREYVELLHGQQFWHWRSFRYGRYREELERREKEHSHTDGSKGTEAAAAVDAGKGGAAVEPGEPQQLAVKMEDG